MSPASSRRLPIKTAAPQRRADATTPAAAASAHAEAAAQVRQTVIEIARQMANTRCTSVRVLDLRGVSPVCDYFILGTGTSGRQMRTVAGEVAELAEARGLGPITSAGTGENWIAVDLFHAVVHLFSHDGRMYYDLDNLWAEATDVEWRDASTPAEATSA